MLKLSKKEVEGIKDHVMLSGYPIINWICNNRNTKPDTEDEEEYQQLLYKLKDIFDDVECVLNLLLEEGV